MQPILVNFGFFQLHSYGLMIALGFLLGGWVAVLYGRKEKINEQIILDCILIVIVAGIVGSRLMYVLGQWSYYRDHLSEIVMVWEGGLVFLGGFFAACLALAWYARRKKVNLLKLLDAVSPGMALGYGIGRLGCFLNGCCFGLPTSVPWGIVFPPGSLADMYFHGEHLHPTQLYSVISGFLIFAALVWFYPRKKSAGQSFLLMFLLYALYRFIVEFFRFSPMHWLSLTPSQWMVVVMVFVLGGFWIRLRSGR